MKLTTIFYALALLFPGIALAGTPISESRALKADAQVDIENVRGAVTVSGWDKDEISITGTLGDGNKGLEIEGGGSHLSVRVEGEKKSGWFGDGPRSDTLLNIKLPRRAAVKIDVVSADVDVSNLAGVSLGIESVSGQIKAQAEVSELNINSVSGSMQLNAIAKRSHIETVSGDIDARGMSGKVKLETVSGRARLQASTLHDLDAGTVSGDIEIHAALEGSAHVDAESMSGSVKIFVPANLSARIEAESFSGRIRSDFGTPKTQEFGPGTSLETTAGAGEAKISLNSFSGDVTLKKE